MKGLYILLYILLYASTCHAGVADLIRQVNRSISLRYVQIETEAFKQASTKYHVPLPVLVSIAWQESHFELYAVNGNCIGIMQVNAKVWAKKLNIPIVMLAMPSVNIEVGAYILHYYYMQTKNWNETIVRYYGLSDFGRHIYLNQVKAKIQKSKEALW